MNQETISYILPTGEECDIRMTELNHKVVALQPTINLNNPNIPHTCIQHIADHICRIDRPYINSIYFESIKFKYRFISFNLYSHVRAAFKKELKKPIPILNLISNKDDYRWIEPDFLPKFPDDIDEILNLTEKRANCLFLATQKGNINGIEYQLHDHKIEYNYVYDLHPTDLIPIFDIYISAKLYTPTSPNPAYDKEMIGDILKEKYYNLKTNLKLIY